MESSEQIFGRGVKQGSPRGPREDHAAVQARFLVEMARALSAAGSPAHRVEEAMSTCAERMGIAAQFFSVPTSVLCTLGEGWDARTYIRGVEPGDVHLERLVRLDRVLHDVASGAMSVEEGCRMIEEIERAPSRYPLWLVVLSVAAASGAIARFFGGGIKEIVASGLCGLLIGAMLVLLAGHRRMLRIIEFAAGFIASIVALGAATWFGPLSSRTVLLSGLIVLVPGLTITMAVNELSTRNLVAGTARLMGAVTILVSIGFGAALGLQIADRLGLAPSTHDAGVSWWGEPIALLVTTLALLVLFKARPRDALSVIGAGALAFYGTRFGSAYFGPELGVCVGGFLVGVASNAVARWRDTPSAVTMVPGIMLLVPGSIGFRSVTAFLEEQTLAGVDAAFRVALIAVSLVAGLLLANVALPSRRAL